MFKYPSEWTESFDSYLAHKHELCEAISDHMLSHKFTVSAIQEQAHSLHTKFFSATEILKNVI